MADDIQEGSSAATPSDATLMEQPTPNVVRHGARHLPNRELHFTESRIFNLPLIFPSKKNQPTVIDSLPWARSLHWRQRWDAFILGKALTPFRCNPIGLEREEGVWGLQRTEVWPVLFLSNVYSSACRL